MRKQWLLPLLAFGFTYALASEARSSPGFVPPQESQRGRQDLASMSEIVDRYIPGFSAFALGTSLRESNWNSNSINDSKSERRKAAQGFKGALSRGFFRDNPYRDEPALWGFGSGGWFGFLPSTGLAQGGKRGPFAEAHPGLVFDPSASVAMIAGFVRRISDVHFEKLPREHRNWYAIRRAMAGNLYIPDWRLEKKRSRESAQRLREDVARALGVSEAEAHRLMSRRVTFRDWPGVGAIWGALSSNA